jgi:cobalt-zinc-cadmium efflux system outer membrane protein
MTNRRSQILAPGLAIFALLFFASPRVAAQQVSISQSPNVAVPANRPAAVPLTLEDLEKLALAHNPTLSQVRSEIRAAEGRKLQSGLYPNPTVGYIGEQIRGGAQRGGEQGFFLQQDIVLGGKLSLNRKIFEQERLQALAESHEQRLRVSTAVRLYFIRALAAQETVAVRSNLVRLAQQAVETSRQLFNVGQADRPDVLEAEVEEQQAELALSAARENQQSVWQSLSATVGTPDLPMAPLAGKLETFGSLDQNTWLARMLEESPAVKIAELGVNKAEAVLARARRQPIPDLQLRAGIEENRELSEFSGQPIGLQGFAQVGVEIPIFNRNQGNLEADQAQLDRARREVERVRLVLRERAAPVFQNYENARDAVQRYKDQMLPRAQQAYDLYLQSYKKMAAAYPQVLIAQRTLFQLEDAYVAALEQLGTSAIALKSFLLTDGLEAPAAPGQMDRPVREINLPAGMSGIRPRE